MRRSPKMKVGLALGGGAARGLAHIGVLRALERERIPIDVISGTSMGAIMGGAYAALPDIAELERKVRGVLGSEEFQRNRLSFLRETRSQRGGLLFSMANLVRRGIFFGVSNLRPSFLSAQEFASSMAVVLPPLEIPDLQIKFGAVCLDIEHAEEVLLRRGDLRRAAAASSAIPGILPPVRDNGRVLIDGGWSNKIPALPCFLMGADVVIAVDITAGLATSEDFRRGADIMVRANEIKDRTLVAFQRSMADVVIRPDVSRVHWADFSAYERCIAAGDDAASAVVSEIRRLLRRERWMSRLRPGRGRRLAEMQLAAGEVGVVVDE